MFLHSYTLPYVRLNQSVLLFIKGACLEEKPLPFVRPNQSLLLLINGACLEEKSLSYVRPIQSLLLRATCRSGGTFVSTEEQLYIVLQLQI
jgi:hypothetical protein